MYRLTEHFSSEGRNPVHVCPARPNYKTKTGRPQSTAFFAVTLEAFGRGASAGCLVLLLGSTSRRFWWSKHFQGVETC